MMSLKVHDTGFVRFQVLIYDQGPLLGCGELVNSGYFEVSITIADTFSRVSGTRYVDAVHIYGLMRADYIPQLFSLRLSYPGIVSELLQRSGAQALIVDPSFKSAVVGSSVPTYVVPDLETLHLNVDCEALPPIRQPLDGDEISMIYHTSGSSSGSPKLVPCTVKWINASVQKIAPLCRPHSQDRQGVATWM